MYELCDVYLITWTCFNNIHETFPPQVTIHTLNSWQDLRNATEFNVIISDTWIYTIHLDETEISSVSESKSRNGKWGGWWERGLVVPQGWMQIGMWVPEWEFLLKLIGLPCSADDNSSTHGSSTIYAYLDVSWHINGPWNLAQSVTHWMTRTSIVTFFSTAVTLPFMLQHYPK